MAAQAGVNEALRKLVPGANPSPIGNDKSRLATDPVASGLGSTASETVAVMATRIMRAQPAIAEANLPSSLSVRRLADPLLSGPQVATVTREGCY
jgi:hypothetical protein